MVMLTVAVVLGLTALAVLHAYWGRGGVWPGHDPQSLARKVYGRAEVAKMPPPWACYAVALALLLAALAAAEAAGRGGFVARATTGAASTALLLRGALGYALPRFTAVSEFGRLNRRVYSPLCLALGLGLAAVGLVRPQGRAT